MDDAIIRPMPREIVITSDTGMKGTGPSWELLDSHDIEYAFGRSFLIRINKVTVPRSAKIKYFDEDLSGNMPLLMASGTRWSNMANNWRGPTWVGDMHEYDIDLSHLPPEPGKSTFVCVYCADDDYCFNPNRKEAITGAEAASVDAICDPRLYAEGDDTPKYLTFRVHPGQFYRAFNLSFMRESDGDIENIDPKIKNNG